MYFLPFYCYNNTCTCMIPALHSQKLQFLVAFNCLKNGQLKRSTLFGERGVRDCLNIVHVHVNDLWGINVKSRCISSHTLLSSSFSSTTLHHSNHQLYVYINIYLFKKVFKRVIKNLRVFLISSN